MSRVDVEVVAVAPVATFEARFEAAAAARTKAQADSDSDSDSAGFDFVYVSQCTFLRQQVLAADVAAFAGRVCAATRPRASSPGAMVVVDGYHGFGALPTDLGVLRAQDKVYYVAGTLKHVAGGANAAFAVFPKAANVEPLLTGWLADPSVLALGSPGVEVASPVAYAPEASLAGGTPAFVPGLLGFVEVMRLWRDRGVTVEKVHAHVVRQQAALVEGLRRACAAAKPATKLDEGARVPVVPPSVPPSDSKRGVLLDGLDPARLCEAGKGQSHTLVFEQDSAARAKEVCEQLARSGIEVDARKNCVRVGFGYCHGPSEVDCILHAVQASIY